jgi:glutathione S-transferase
MSLLVTEMLLSGAIPGVEAGPLGPGMRGEVQRVLAWIDDDMADREFAVGESFGAADVMLAYALGFARTRGFLTATRHLEAYLTRMTSRDAYARAQSRGA